VVAEQATLGSGEKLNCLLISFQNQTLKKYKEIKKN